MGARTGVTSVEAAPAARGVGLTPRLFRELVGKREAHIAALPAAYVPVIRQHVESVAPSKQVMAQNYVPVVVEGEDGMRRVLHVDPLAVRQFRRTVAEELRCVREKRRRMMRRMKALRQELPTARDQDVAPALECEIAVAEARAGEPLLQPLPVGTRSLHVLVEATPCMVQLSLVCEHLIRELPVVLAAAGCRRLSLLALGVGSSQACEGPAALPSVHGAELQEALKWLQQLAAAAQAAKPPAGATAGQAGAKESTLLASSFRLAPALRRAAAAGSQEGSTAAVLLLACSPPDDLDASLAAIQDGGLALQAVGVFGLASEDPEPALQALASRASRESSLYLFFGSEYWTKFAGVRRRQLERLRRRMEAERQAYGPEREGEDGDVTSPKVFELRLVERAVRECYVQEQSCEQELTCASRVLDRTLVDREDVLAA
eukprot:CAMPEP_0179186104 /NCGR_PEP_ID=MMETSP0796-20121207/92294_1 /TAXON_ID=73915 /ORGANISM="Pyrodinium bahamense, Strain pbaha01" /LENGTH=432 /DNA_ID=CAMNT_0020890077 /DNA_START=55 /DNA_END=1350 /DNA_ORIENTATION=+